MYLDKAIEILSDSAFNGSTTHGPDFKDALKLGIEALKRLKDNRRDPEFDHWWPLPGETPLKEGA